MKQRVVSGIQATGSLHLGNYLGAVQNWIELQNHCECFFFLADLHTITTEQCSNKVSSSLFHTLAMLLAAKLDPKKVIIFVQSMISEHTEFAWILNCITPIGWLNRMIQFKDKTSENQNNAKLGLFSYPVLMSADILLYNPDLVPVGEDQKQHIELTRAIAKLLNRKVGQKTFNIPEALIIPAGKRIMSLKNAQRKMSKSDCSDVARINLNDSKDRIALKIKKAKTDLINNVSYDNVKRPEVSNLINIYSLLTKQSVAKIADYYSDSNFDKFKKDLIEIIIESLDPIQKRYNDIIRNPDYLIKILKNGSLQAKTTASKTFDSIKKTFGLIT